MKTLLIFIFVLSFPLFPVFVFGQSPIITAFPSLRIPSSSRGLSMGDCGVASAGDNQQLYYNIAKTAFTKNYHQVSVGYTPWLGSVSNDTRFMNVNYVANTSNTSAFGLALAYLRLGNVQTRDNNGALIAQYNANEFSLLSSFALQLNEKASLGVGLRLLSSQPGFSFDPVSYSTVPRHIFSASGDVGYYQQVDLGLGKLEIGAAVTNLGPKVSMDGTGSKTFLPTNLCIGVSYLSTNDNNSQITLALDANKLMVPSPPAYDGSGNILLGKDPNRSVLNALFSSFADAPGGFKEELREIRLNIGAEFAFEKTFFLRCGLSLENQLKGNRKFIGFGAGYQGMFTDQSWGFDFHYLVPMSTVAAISPFQNSWGFSLRFSLGSFE